LDRTDYSIDYPLDFITEDFIDAEDEYAEDDGQYNFVDNWNKILIPIEVTNVENDTLPKELETLVTDKNNLQRRKIMAKESVEEREIRAESAVSPEELEKLATDKEWTVRMGIAKNKNTPVSVLEKLAVDEEVVVRSTVAENENTPVSLLGKLAVDKESSVRQGVAGNKNTPASLLEKLAVDKESSVLQRVAGNKNTPVSLLEKLARGETQWVRKQVAGNENTPVSLLEKLAIDEEVMVRMSVVRNENTPGSLLEILAVDKNENVRRTVAGNKNTLVSLLEKLAIDKESSVRQGVAGNENTPVLILAKLAGDKNKDVRKAATENENTPASAGKQISVRKPTEHRDDICKFCGKYIFSEGDITLEFEAVEGDRIEWAMFDKYIKLDKSYNLKTDKAGIDFEQLKKEWIQYEESNSMDFECVEKILIKVKYWCPHCEAPYFFYEGDSGIEKDWLEDGYDDLEDLIESTSNALVGNTFQVSGCYLYDNHSFKHRGGAEEVDVSNFDDVSDVLYSDNIEVGVQSFDKKILFFSIKPVTFEN